MFYTCVEKNPKKSQNPPQTEVSWIGVVIQWWPPVCPPLGAALYVEHQSRVGQ